MEGNILYWKCSIGSVPILVGGEGGMEEVVGGGVREEGEVMREYTGRDEGIGKVKKVSVQFLKKWIRRPRKVGPSRSFISGQEREPRGGSCGSCSESFLTPDWDT